MTGAVPPRATLPRVVLVTRPTDYEALLAVHATREQARFFLSTREQSIEEVEARHQRFLAGLAAIRNAVPVRWRYVHVQRADLARFVFEPADVVVVFGQDGLVANAAKYLDGQLVVGVNAEPERFPGVLVPHRLAAAPRLVHASAEGSVVAEERTMVEAALDDGQRLVALNEVFVGHWSHQSARYRIGHGAGEEEQSSSGLIVATGTGASGWALSISRERAASRPLPAPTEARLAFFVREAWPSRATGASIVDGELRAGEELRVVSHMNEGGVLFGDGIEADRLAFPWGVTARLGVASRRLRLVASPA